MTHKLVFQLRDVYRNYSMGGSEVQALHDVNLDIYEGDYIAITGPSGSGKTTLLNVLGTIDRPDKGEVFIRGQNLQDLNSQEIALLRASRIGFVFQNFQLLAELTALENVALAGIYCGMDLHQCNRRARELLESLGLYERLHHLPRQLSAGQQQRVGVARALFHDGAIILADEPTGALDTATGRDFLKLLRLLNEGGATVIVVTHDPVVAAEAKRIIGIADGRVVADNCGRFDEGVLAIQGEIVRRRLMGPLLSEMLRSALKMMRQRLLRTCLTLFGMVVGIASMIVISSVGAGARSAVENTMSSLGANLIIVMRDFSRLPVGSSPPAGFVENDASVLQTMAGITAAILEAPRESLVSTEERSVKTLVTGTMPGLPMVHDWALSEGTFFTQRDYDGFQPVAVLGKKTANELFVGSAVGQNIEIESSVFEVIGVMEGKGANPAGVDLDDVVLVPFSSARVRLGFLGEASFVMIKARDGINIESLAEEVQSWLENSRGQPDVSARSLEEIIEAQARARDTLTILLGCLAFTSLVVGGVGITNITLVGVLERTREIGLRKVLGARSSDILLQILIETGGLAVLGGLIGLALGVGCAALLRLWGVPAESTVFAAVLALTSSVGLGIVAGILPARRAAGLDPVKSLGRS